MIDDTVAEIGVNTKGASCLFKKRCFKAACGGNSRYRETCCPKRRVPARKNNHPERNLRTLSSVLKFVTIFNVPTHCTFYQSAPLSCCRLLFSLLVLIFPSYLLICYNFDNNFDILSGCRVCSSFCSLFSFPPSVTAPKYKPQHVTNC